MNLKTYNGRKHKAGFYFRYYPANGSIMFSPELTDTLKLKSRDRVCFHQNTDKPEEWFLEFRSHGYLLYKIHNGLLGIANQTILTAILKSRGLKKEKGLFTVDMQPVKDDTKILYRIGAGQTNLPAPG